MLALFLGLTLQSNFVWAQSAGTCGIVPDFLAAGSGTFTTALCEANATALTAATVAEVAVSASSSADSGLTGLAKQAAQYAQQLEQYAQEVIAAQNLVIQTERMIKDLEENPLQVIVPDTKQLVENQKRIDQLAKDIANNSNTIGSNLMKDLTNPSTIGLGEGSRFQLWSEARSAAIQESYDKVAAFAKNEPAESKRITQAIKNIDGAEGKTATDKAMANAAGQQLALIQDIKEMLRQLLSMQSTENGAKLDAQVSAATAAVNAVIQNPPGSTLNFAPDSYDGPGTTKNKAF